MKHDGNRNRDKLTSNRLKCFHDQNATDNEQSKLFIVKQLTKDFRYSQSRTIRIKSFEMGKFLAEVRPVPSSSPNKNPSRRNLTLG